MNDEGKDQQLAVVPVIEGIRKRPEPNPTKTGIHDPVDFSDFVKPGYPRVKRLKEPGSQAAVSFPVIPTRSFRDVLSDLRKDAKLLHPRSVPTFALN
jgi:hypothetical protein